MKKDALESAVLNEHERGRTLFLVFVKIPSLVYVHASTTFPSVQPPTAVLLIARISAINIHSLKRPISQPFSSLVSSTTLASFFGGRSPNIVLPILTSSLPMAIAPS